MKLTHDSKIDAYTLSHDATKLDAPGDVDAWKSEAQAQLSQLGDNKVDLLVDVSALHIDSKLAEQFVEAANEIFGAHTRHTVHYGDDDVADRDAAIKALAAMRERTPTQSEMKPVDTNG